MIAALSKWEQSYLPAIAVEQTEQQSTAAFWGAMIPAIPDVISQEQFRTGMSYETASSACSTRTLQLPALSATAASNSQAESTGIVTAFPLCTLPIMDKL